MEKQKDLINPNEDSKTPSFLEKLELTRKDYEAAMAEIAKYHHPRKTKVITTEGLWEETSYRHLDTRPFNPRSRS